jgi:hypothetical protein
MESDRLSLSIGTGASIYKPAFIVSTNVGLRLGKYINVLMGFDVYTNSTSVSRSFSFNLIPYYILKPSNKTMFQIGIGGSYFRRRFVPIFSARFDYALTKKSLVGGEIKSFLMTNTDDEFPFPILQLNYSVIL